LIVTLFITIVVEGVIVLVYSLWYGKPAIPILITAICSNLMTQSLLWILLQVFFQAYLVTLIFAEMLIWVSEGLLLYSIPANRLSFKEAVLLSLGMNLLSFSLGWFLPV